jgi:hypothetical protein
VETGPSGSEGGRAEKDQPGGLTPRRAADPAQILQRELLDDVTNRPHQSLGMAFPADRFTSRPIDADLPLRLPPTLAVAVPVPAPSIESQDPPQESLPAPLVLSANGIDPVNLAVEVTRIVPGSGNLTIHGQQFWLGPDRAATPVTFWADTTVVHLLHNGVRLKTVPSRLTAAHLRQLLADDGHPAGPPPIATGTAQPGGPIEVDRLVNATGLVGLAGRQHPIGYHFAGRRASASTTASCRSSLTVSCCAACPARSPPPTSAGSGTPDPPDHHPNRHPNHSACSDASAAEVPLPLPTNASTSASPTPAPLSTSKPPTAPSASTTATSSLPK